MTDWEQFSVDSGGASPMEERDIWELEPCDELKWDDWEAKKKANVEANATEKAE